MNDNLPCKKIVLEYHPLCSTEFAMLENMVIVSEIGELELMANWVVVSKLKNSFEFAIAEVCLVVT